MGEFLCNALFLSSQERLFLMISYGMWNRDESYNLVKERLLSVTQGANLKIIKQLHLISSFMN